MSPIQRHFQQHAFLPTGSYVITNVRHGVSILLPNRRDELCGSPNSRFKWKIVNDSNKRWYVQGGDGPWFAHRRPAPRAGNPIIASPEQFGWVICQCHAIRDPDCYLIYANSDPTLLWGVHDCEDETPITLCTGESNRKNWWKFESVVDNSEEYGGAVPWLKSPSHVDPPRYVAVMGATGSGISSFINDASGLKLDVRDDLDSCTNRVHATQILLDGRPVVLLDTPGFGHSSLSDTEVLRLTAEYLAKLYRKELKLSGLLYMQRISDPRSDRQTRHNFRIFTKLCGHANLDRTVVVTTRWNEVDSKDGSGRENELKAGVFKPLLNAGGKIVRHDQTVGSAKEILRRVITQDVRVLAIQSQIVDDGKDLLATDAGLEVSRDVVVTRPRGFGSWLRKLWGG